MAEEEIEINPAIEVGTDLSIYGVRKSSKYHMIIYYPSLEILDLIDRYYKKEIKRFILS